MNVEELAKERDNLFPKEIAGYKRPDAFLDKSNDFFDELPQFIQKDPVYFKILNYIFSVLISNDVRVKSWVDSLSSDMNEQDFRVVTELVKGVMTPEMLKKLNGIEVGAQVNKNAFGKIQVNGKIYNAMILQDAIELIEGNNVTLSIDTATGAVTLNAKDTTYAIVSTTADGLVPKRDGSANKYLCADGTWKQVTQYIHPDSGITAGTYKSVTVNAQGHVTAGSNPTTLAGYGITDAAPLDHGIHVPSGGSDSTFLRGDGTWALVQGIPVGDVVYRPFLMDGYVKANGATVNRSDYPSLAAYATEHNLWTDDPASGPYKYGRGDGSTTMVLPDYRNRVIQGGDIITFTTGTVSNGSSIPLPDGYTREQCKYAVWPHYMPDANASYNSGSNHITQVDQNTGYTSCIYTYNGSNRLGGTAGYMCVASKHNDTNNFFIPQLKY